MRHLRGAGKQYNATRVKRGQHTFRIDPEDATHVALQGRAVPLGQLASRVSAAASSSIPAPFNQFAMHPGVDVWALDHAVVGDGIWTICGAALPVLLRR